MSQPGWMTENTSSQQQGVHPFLQTSSNPTNMGGVHPGGGGGTETPRGYNPMMQNQQHTSESASVSAQSYHNPTQQYQPQPQGGPTGVGSAEYYSQQQQTSQPPPQFMSTSYGSNEQGGGSGSGVNAGGSGFLPAVTNTYGMMGSNSSMGDQQQSQPQPQFGGGEYRSYNDPSLAAGNDAGLLPPTARRFGDPNDDLPLLEELGVFPAHIRAKAMVVLNPFKRMEQEITEDTDVAGPICFAVMLGCLLSLQGKIQFGAIYIVSILGVLFAKALLTLMTENSVCVVFVVSSLGYCLLPNVVLAVVQTFQFWLFGVGKVMLPVASVTIFWSAWCATKMIITALRMHDQKWLILYPLVLFYSTFAALTIF